MTRPRLLLLTGPKGVGKTTLCSRLADLAAKEGVPAAGILSRSIPAAAAGAGGAGGGPGEGERIGLEAEALPGRERWLLARTNRRLGGPSCGPFSFSRTGIERAVRHLRDCRASGAVLLIVDEVGPLELDRRLGFYPFLQTLRHPAGQTVLLVVRPALVAAAGRLAGPGATAQVVTVTPANRDELPRLILEALP